MSKIQVNEIVNHFDNGAPDCPRGLTVTGVSTFSGDVSIGGTLTYEDVTNIDSVGIITAQSGIKVPGGSVAIGLDVTQAPLHVKSSVARASIVESTSTDGSYASFVDPNTSSYDRVQIGSAGNDLVLRTTEVERVRIDSSGNVGIATDNPTAKLQIGSIESTNPTAPQSLFITGTKTNYASINGLPQNQLVIYDDTTSTAGSGGAIGFVANCGPTQKTWIASVEGRRDDSSNDGSNYAGSLVFYTRPAQSIPVERQKIRSNGQSFYFSDSSFVFRTVRTGAGDAFLSFQSGATSIENGTQKCRILADGDLENTNNNYGALSDAKLKENIVDAESQWEDLKAINVRNFNFKEELGFGTNTKIGVVAQELELVSPNLVKTIPDRDNDDNDLGTTTKSVKYSVLYMKAIKALQEAMGRIETLEAEVQALKGN